MNRLIRVIFKEFIYPEQIKLCPENLLKKNILKKYIGEGLNFLIDMFVECGHDRNYLNS